MTQAYRPSFADLFRRKEQEQAPSRPAPSIPAQSRRAPSIRAPSRPIGHGFPVSRTKKPSRVSSVKKPTRVSSVKKPTRGSSTKKPSKVSSARTKKPTRVSSVKKPTRGSSTKKPSRVSSARTKKPSRVSSVKKRCTDKYNKETCYQNYWHKRCDDNCCNTCQKLDRRECNSCVRNSNACIYRDKCRSDTTPSGKNRKGERLYNVYHQGECEDSAQFEYINRNKKFIDGLLRRKEPFSKKLNTMTELRDKYIACADMRELFLSECVCQPDSTHMHQIIKHRELGKYIDDNINKYIGYTQLKKNRIIKYNDRDLTKEEKQMLEYLNSNPYVL